MFDKESDRVHLFDGIEENGVDDVDGDVDVDEHNDEYEVEHDPDEDEDEDEDENDEEDEDMGHLVNSKLLTLEN